MIKGSEKYLSDFQAVINFVLERTHLHFADEMGVDEGLSDDERQEL